MREDVRREGGKSLVVIEMLRWHRKIPSTGCLWKLICNLRWRGVSNFRTELREDVSHIKILPASKSAKKLIFYIQFSPLK